MRYARLASTVSAAMRLMPIGQSGGARHASRGRAPNACRLAVDSVETSTAPSNRFTPLMDIAAMTQQSWSRGCSDRRSRSPWCASALAGQWAPGKPRSIDALCKTMRERYRLGVITNDIFTREDMEFLVRSQALTADRIIGVQTGGCPHTAIREDASMNFDALDELTARASRSRPRVSRKRRRQPGGELQPGARGRVDLRRSTSRAATRFRERADPA